MVAALWLVTAVLVGATLGGTAGAWTLAYVFARSCGDGHHAAMVFADEAGRDGDVAFEMAAVGAAAGILAWVCGASAVALVG